MPFLWRIGLSAGLIGLLAGAGLYLRHTGYVSGKADEQALRASQDAIATKAHEALIAKLDEEHHAALQSLEAERDAALAHPVVRRIRVSVPASCPTPSTEDAGVPTAAPAADGLLEVDDPDYGRLREWLLRYASTTANVGR